MTAQTKATIKTYFETGDIPTQAQFADLADSYEDTGAVSTHNSSATAHGLTTNISAALSAATSPSAGNAFITAVSTVEVANIKAYGAVDGADSTTAIAAAIAALSNGGTLYIPRGTFHVASTLTISKPLVIRGDGAVSILRTKSTATTLIMFDLAPGADRTVFKDLFIDSAATMTDGAAVRVGNAGQVSSVRFSNVSFVDQYIAISFVQALAWNVTDCQFTTNAGQTSSTQILIQNASNPDGGDNVIAGCLFNGAGTNTSLINHITGGGLKIIGSKFLGATYGYLVQYSGSTGSGAIEITGCSMEGATSAEVYLTVAGAFGFQNIAISGCEFGGDATQMIDIESASIFAVSVSGCNFVGSSYGMIVRGVTGLVVSGCSFMNLAGGIYLLNDPAVSAVVLGYNLYYTVGTPLTDAGLKAIGAAQV
jgi:hypothetical protein